MNLIQYMLIPVGLSNAITTSDLVLSGIAYTTFLIIGLVTLLSLPLYTSLISLSLKISVLICWWPMYFSYRLLKKRIKEFVEMYDEIQVVSNKRFSQSRFTFSLLFFLASYFIALVIVIHNAFFNPACFENLQPVKLNLMLYQHGAITVVVILYWYFVVQFVHYELSLKYYSYLSQSNDIINKFVAFNPNFLIRHQIHQVIIDFQENRQKWSQTVIPLKRFICLMIVALNVVMLLQYLSNIEYNVNVMFNELLLISYCIINFYSFVTQIGIYKISRIEDTLINTLTNWRNNYNPGNPLIVIVVAP